MKVKFKRERETKNTVRFQEVEEKGKPLAIGTLYIQKRLAGDREEITIDIEET